MTHKELIYNILIDDKLSSGEKVLLLFILETTQKTNSVFQLSNSEITNILNETNVSHSRKLSSLKQKGYIKILYTLDGKQIKDRVVVYSRLTNEEEKLFNLENQKYVTLEEMNEIREKRTDEYNSDEIKTTNVGYVYIIKSEYGYKLGKSKKIEDRLSLFNVKLPFKIDVVGYYMVKNMSKMETYLHKKYNHLRLEGEWFNLSKEDLLEVSSTLTKNQI
jgi:DNA-binding MarR family transcriptional regulator